MSEDSARSLADWFDELVLLEPAARAARLDAVPAEHASRLRALLAADAATDGDIAAALARDARGQIAPDLSGQRIGAWRVRHELGAGGMGLVLLVEREQAGFTQQAALKLIRGFPSEEGMRRLRHERQILATLDHPDIARLIDGGETADGQPYLVVEYVRGQTLDAHLHAQQPDRDQRIQLIERIGAAVQHAHQHLVIHRDLKPANVMITGEGDIKLLDFGVAKLLDLGQDSQGSTRVYTPGYASPEQTRGEPIGIATDIYSLGRMLHELLVGTLAQSQQGIDADLAGIIAKATAERPAERYASMASFCEDLSRYRRGLPVSAAADTAWYRSRKFVARHRFGVAAAVSALVLIAVLVWRLAAALEVAQEQTRLADQQRAAAEQHLARSRAVVLFFAEMFEGVAPEHALGRALQPAELLRRAERQLRERPPQDASLRADLAAEVGSLYQRLGDGDNAVRLLQSSLEGQAAGDRESAIELAARRDRLALALQDLDRRDEALLQTEAAVALRKRFAAEDPSLNMQSHLELARAFVRVERNDDARRELRAAALLLQRPGIEALQRVDFHQAESMLAFNESRFMEARSAAQAGLAILQAHPALDQTRSIEFERTIARAEQGLGRLDEAEAAFARAIAAQTRWIGDHGTRAMGLHSDHGFLLATLGRFDAALDAYAHAARIFADAGGPAPERNPRHLNNSCDAEMGRGDYAAALQLCTAAADILGGERDEHDPERLAVESNLARATALAGQPKAALRQFDSVLARAAAASGADSFPVALHAFRAGRAALLAGRVEHARQLSDRALAIYETLFPPPHPWRVRALRLSGLVALAGGDLALADTQRLRAEQEAALVFPQQHPLRAQLALDRAELAQRRADRTGVREALAAALPGLRSCCLPSEIDRRRAERLAAEVAPAPSP